MEEVPQCIVHLANGPIASVNRYGAYCVNGFKFHMSYIEQKQTIQNNGVVQAFKKIVTQAQGPKSSLSPPLPKLRGNGVATRVSDVYTRGEYPTYTR